MIYFVVTTALAFIFFLLFPLLGAFHVRKKWRLFRRKITQASFFPQLNYRTIRSKESGFLGNYRFFGSIQAIQNDDTLWISNKKLSITIELDYVTVYQLPVEDYSGEKRSFSEEPIQVMESKQIGALPEGTHVLVSGPLFVERGLAVYRSDNNTPLSILIYDGPKKTILRRTIWGGRQKNEYWNTATPGSMILGVLSLLALGYFLVRNPSLYNYAVIAFTAALLPLVPILPPGVFFFYFYSRFWRQARYYRAERDLFLLPLRYFSTSSSVTPDESVVLPDQEKYHKKRYANLDAAMEAVPEGFIHQFPLKERVEITQYHGFGIKKKGFAGKLMEPEDPMVESVIMPGNPYSLSAACVKQAKRYGMFSGIFFSIAFVVNTLILFFLLFSIIR